MLKLKTPIILYNYMYISLSLAITVNTSITSYTYCGVSRFLSLYQLVNE